MLTVFLFAQAGVPLTSGFFAKFYVINAAVDAGSTWLAVVAMLSAGHRRLPLPAHHREPVHGRPEEARAGAPRLTIPVGAGIALALCLVVTLVVGVWPARSPARRRTRCPHRLSPSG